jgi:hypothetical protein
MEKENCDGEEVEEAKNSVVKQHGGHQRRVNVGHHRRRDDDVVEVGQHIDTLRQLDSISRPGISFLTKWKGLDVQNVYSIVLPLETRRPWYTRSVYRESYTRRSCLNVLF